MKVIELQEFGSIDSLVYTDRPIPSIKEDEVLVKVKALSINPVDVKTRSGRGMANRYRNQLPVVLGWDIAGIVEQVGSRVSKFKVGDEVFGMVNFPEVGNAYAEHVAAPASNLAIKPSNISFEEAAAATLAALTAWQGLVHQAKIKAGQNVLVQAAAGGVGHFAVQMARHLGASVTGTSSAANKDFVLQLGADKHIDYHTQPLTALGTDYDVVIDPIGGDNIEKSFAAVKKGGIVLSIVSAFADLIKEKSTSLGVNGFFYMVQTSEEDITAIAQLLEQGIIRAHVSQTFSFADMKSAHQAVESGRTRGKVIVTL